MRVAAIVGTRPDAIKMAPVVVALRQRPGVEVSLISSGQHRELAPQALAVFGLEPDVDLAVMTPGQDLAGLTARIVERCAAHLAAQKPDVVLVHGDTTTAFAAAVAAFYCRIPVGHVEAGLRTGERYSPFPEEMNRVLADRLAELHFAPTEGAAANLRQEGISPHGVWITGNTGVDALLAVAGPRRRRPAGSQRLIVVEAHRRENLGEPMRRIAEAVRTLVRARDDVTVVWSVHPNPAVEGPVRGLLADEPRVELRSPPPYGEWARLLAEADLLLVDSGGLQEEAPALGVPLLILRESTERPEVVAWGAGQLVGTEPARIVEAVKRLLDDPGAYQAMASAGSPFGDGRAAERTVQFLLYYFGRVGAPPEAFRPAAPARLAPA